MNKKKQSGSGKYLTIAITLVFFLGIIYKGFSLNSVKKINDIFTNQIALENTYYIIQIILGIMLAIGAIIAVWQYVLTANAERARLNNERIRNAIERSEYYKDNILRKYSVVRYIFNSLGIKDILMSIDPERMKNFNNSELQTVLSDTKQKEIRSILSSEKVTPVLLDAEKIFNLNWNLEKYIKEETDPNGNVMLRLDQKKQQAVMARFVSSLLNNMEFFAMYFNYEAADEAVVYQPLHQTYIEAVQLLYYDISRNNIDEQKKFYTNVIDLYKTWYKKSKEHDDQISNTTNKMKGPLMSHLR